MVEKTSMRKKLSFKTDEEKLRILNGKRPKNLSIKNLSNPVGTREEDRKAHAPSPEGTLRMSTGVLEKTSWPA